MYFLGSSWTAGLKDAPISSGLLGQEGLKMAGWQDDPDRFFKGISENAI